MDLYGFLWIIVWNLYEICMDLFVWLFIFIFMDTCLEVWNTSLFVKNPCWFGCGP